MKGQDKTPLRGPGLSDTEQEPLRSLRFPSRPAGAPPADLEDQEDYDRFVSGLRAKIAHRLESEIEPDVQATIAILMRLLTTMRRGTLARNRIFFETAFDLLAAEKPNLTLVRSLCFDLATAEEKDARGLTGAILWLTGSTPITAVLAALGSILAVLLLIVALLSAGHAAFGYVAQELDDLHPLAQVLSRLSAGDIMILVISSFLGSIVSVLARLRSFLSGATFQPLIIYLSVLTKPFLSVLFALFVYAVMKAGLIAFPGVDMTGPSALYVVWVIGFLSGFSERFSQDFIAGAESKLVDPLGGKQQSSPPTSPS